MKLMVMLAQDRVLKTWNSWWRLVRTLVTIIDYSKCLQVKHVNIGTKVIVGPFKSSNCHTIVRLIACVVFTAVFNIFSGYIAAVNVLIHFAFIICFQYIVQYSLQTISCFTIKPPSKQWSAMKEEWILSQRLSSVLGKKLTEPMIEPAPCC